LQSPLIEKEFIGWPICFAFAIPASMILCAFSIVIMTVDLPIEKSHAAFATEPCRSGRPTHYSFRQHLLGRAEFH
jgi:hypothetical protein